MQERKRKLGKASALIQDGDFKTAKSLFHEIFFGVTGKQAEPGMAGSLLYHMAMVTKMEAEPRVLLEELKAKPPEIDRQLQESYDDYVSDVLELSKLFLPLKKEVLDVSSRKSLTAEEKIQIYTSLQKRTSEIACMLDDKNPDALQLFHTLFDDWATTIVEMRSRQEYETIKGLLTLAELVKQEGLLRVSQAMERVKDKFGRETVNIALNVTLKVGMRREKLQSLMLSDHFIDYQMNLETLDGKMRFLNCPIHGSHKYLETKMGITDDVASLFCKHFCFAHANAMLETVLPFAFHLTHPYRMNLDGACEFQLKLGYSPTATHKEKHVPLVVSWNLTRKCTMKCPHCYINATTTELKNELTTEEAYGIIDQIAEVSSPLLILSGGEPLLRKDVYDIIKYGARKGFRMGLGTSGTLVDEEVARRLKEAGLATASVSIDSSNPSQHDEFKGVPGSWNKAIEAIKALRKHEIQVQVNTTLTQENYNQIDEIMTIVENLGVENFHLFFLVPTGRGAKITDISPKMYEDMIRTIFSKTHKHKLNVRPSCAPQFMRIAKDMGVDMRQWIRGCLAGLYYCRVYPTGDITPCPYLPVRLGNIRKTPFKDIWFKSPVFKSLRNPAALKGKCHTCNYSTICGGCRARAYGLSDDFIDFCGDLREPAEIKGDYLVEDPYCDYKPEKP